MRGAIKLASLLRSQWDSAERLRQRQSRMLRTLVYHACTTVPWYRDLFHEAGVDPREIRGIDDLAKIPVTTRSDLQEQPPERLISSKADPSRLMSSRTSGATGEPLEIRYGPADRTAMNPSFLRVQPQDHTVPLTGQQFTNSSMGSPFAVSGPWCVKENKYDGIGQRYSSEQVNGRCSERYSRPWRP
jgi:hypothetical protein